MDAGGQEALFDTFLFLTIISVGSCVITSASTVLIGYGEINRRDTAIAYARSSLDALLRSTLDDAHYLDGGRIVSMGNNTTVEDYLIKVTYLMHKGKPAAAFDDCNERLEAMTRDLLTGAYRYTLMTEVVFIESRETIFSIGDPPTQYGYSAYSSYTLPGFSMGIELAIRFA